MRKKVLKFQLVSWIFLLTFVAGFMNIASVLTVSMTTSHHTGNLTNMVIQVATGDFSRLLSAITVLASYFVGTIFSGFLFPDQRFKAKIRYSWIQIFCGFLLSTVAIFHLRYWMILAIVPFILGLQNGMFVFYKGIIVRTTHMTGNITDAGLAIGRVLAGRKSELWKVRFQLMNVISFVGGGFLGKFVFLYTDWNIWLIGGCLYLFTGTLYFFLHHHLLYVMHAQTDDEILANHLIDLFK